MEPGQEKHLAEYNDGFMMDMRSFLKGMRTSLTVWYTTSVIIPARWALSAYMLIPMAFTLMDMVSLDAKAQ